MLSMSRRLTVQLGLHDKLLPLHHGKSAFRAFGRMGQHRVDWLPRFDVLPPGQNLYTSDLQIWSSSLRITLPPQPRNGRQQLSLASECPQPRF